MNCDESLDDAIRNLHSLIEESGAVITRGALPSVTGDPVQMTRLFQNLLVNSIKYRSAEVPRFTSRPKSRERRLAVSRYATTESASSRSMRRRCSAFSNVLQPRDQTLRKRHGPGDLPEDREPP